MESTDLNLIASQAQLFIKTKPKQVTRALT